MRSLIAALLLLAPLSVSAQTAVPWNVAEITITPPTLYIDDVAVPSTAVLSYQLETQDPGKTDWRILTTIKTLMYRHTGLVPGLHFYRVIAITADGVLSEPSASASKNAVPPATKPPSIIVK